MEYRKVLIAEDTPEVMRLASASVRMKGYDVLEAPDGDEALRMLGDHKHELYAMMTDNKMPGMRGIDILRYAAQKREEGDTDYSRIRFGMFADTNEFPEIPGEVRGMGFTYVPKPYGPKIIHDFLESKKETQ